MLSTSLLIGMLVMACWGNEYEYDMSSTSECSECGTTLDADGVPLEFCYYSPEVCEHCGWKPCDGSC